MEELEVKARVDDPAALIAALAAAGARLTFRGRMIDRRFDRDGMLAARDEVLRLRVYRPADGPGDGVLGWKGPHSRRGGYRHRTEHEVRLADPEAALAILARLGFVETLRIDRAIEQFALDGAVIRLERYPEMDVLVEIEGPPRAIEGAVAATGMPRERFLAESLPYFVAAFERRTGRPARLAGDVAP